MTTPLLLLCLFGIFLSLVLGAAFSMMESAVLAINRSRLIKLFGDEHPESTSEQEIFRETKEIYFISRLGLCTMLVIGGFCTYRLMLAAMQATPLPNAFIVPISMVLAIAVLSPPFLLFVFTMPRLIASPMALDDDISLPRWINIFIFCVHPLAQFARVMNLPLIRLLIPKRQLTKNELVALVTMLDVSDDEDEEENSLSALDEETDEEEIIYNILDLEDTFVREVMKPINSVVAIRRSDITVKNVRELSLRTGYSRFPIYNDRIVNLIGCIDVYDILIDTGHEREIDAYIKDAYYVPEFMRVNALLQELRSRNIDAAIVVDEHGGSSGWITREDVLEEIVGEIEDEFDARKRRLHQVEDGSYMADGALDIDDLSEELLLEFEEPQYDTLAGFMLMMLGMIPEVGDQVQTDEATYTVEELENKRIARIRIQLREHGGTEEE